MRGRGDGLARARQAVAALEFALVAPVLLTLFLGAVDTVRCLVYVDLARRATISAGNAASNAVAAGATVSPATLSTILQQVETQSSSYIWASPGQTNGIILSVLHSNASGNTITLDTQAKYPTSLSSNSVYGCAANANLPSAFKPNPGIASDMFIVAELFYTFQPFVFSSGLMGAAGAYLVRDKSFHRVRQPMTPTTGGTC